MGSRLTQPLFLLLLLPRRFAEVQQASRTHASGKEDAVGTVSRYGVPTAYLTQASKRTQVSGWVRRRAAASVRICKDNAPPGSPGDAYGIGVANGMPW